MTLSISQRASNEKYFNSIKFYYHNSSVAIKKRIFTELLDANILLAAHCIITDFPNKEFEKQAIDVATVLAKDFKNEVWSSKGLLALAELKQFGQILDIFDSIAKPNKIHHSVLNRVFQEADEKTFLIFINSLSEHRHLKAIGTSFLQYPHKLNLIQESLYILQKFILKLFQENAVGLLRAFLEKFELYDFIGFFFSVDVITFSKELMVKTSKHLVLAYHIIRHFNYFRIIGLDFLISQFSLNSSDKLLKYPLHIALEYKVYDNNDFNNQLSSLFKLGKNKKTKNINLVKRLTGFGLSEYVEATEKLTNQYLDFCFRNNIKLMCSIGYQKLLNEHQDDIQYFDTGMVEIIIRIISQSFKRDQEDELPTLEEFWNIYFNSSSPIIRYYPLEPIIEKVRHLYEVDYRALFKVIRHFAHNGILQNVVEVGGYMVPLQFRSIKLLFLHREQTSENHLEDVGNEFIFRIIGYNPQTKRLNISTLSIDEILENAKRHEGKI